MYVAIDDGPTLKDIPLCDTESFKWFDFEDVESNLKFDNLKDFWNTVKKQIYEILKNEVENNG